MGLDLTKLKVKDSKEPVRSRPGRTATPNPFMEVMLESYETDKAKSVTVPNGDEKNDKGEFRNVVTVRTLLRNAASAQGIGVRIEEVPGTDSTEIKFQAKEKTERKPREESAEGSEANAA